MFTARKMSAQAKVNDYNAKLMQISNQETQLANQQSAIQQGANQTSVFNQEGTNNGLNAQQQALSQKQKQLDTEKQRVTTLLQQAQNELQQVEKAEEQGIKNSTAKYVG